MPNVLVLYYSSYGHIELMAGAQAEGAARIPSVRVLVKRVPETVPPEIADRDAALHELAHETNYAPTIGPIWRIIVHSWRIKLSKPKFRPPSGTSRGTKSDPQCSVNPEFGIVSGLWRRT